MRWRKPPKETERTFRDASMTQGDHVGGFLGGGLAAGSYEPLIDLLLVPFKLAFQFVALLIKLCLFIVHHIRRHEADGASEPQS